MHATITLKDRAGEHNVSVTFDPRNNGERIIADAQLAYLTSDVRMKRATCEHIAVFDDNGVQIAQAVRRTDTPIGAALCPYTL